MAFIEVRDLSRTYRTPDGINIAAEQRVFHGLSLDFEEGEFVAVVGPSGCGKSTLLNMIGGLDSAERKETVRVQNAENGSRGRGKEVAIVEGGGTITIGGFPISTADGDDKADFINRNIGFVFQFHHLIPELSAVENVELPRLIRRDNRNKSREAALDMLAKVELAAHADKKPAVLSGGEKQRVAIARSLINRPRLLLADEPTGSLDPTLKGTIFDLLRKINEDDGVTIILITHDLGLLYKDDGRLKTDRVIELTEAKKGLLTVQDSPTMSIEGIEEEQ